MKKILAIMLTLVLTCGMFFATAVTAYAATPKIVGFSAAGIAKLTDLATPSTNPSVSFNTLKQGLSNAADSTYLIQLDVNDFTWEGDDKPVSGRLTSAHLEDVKISLKDKKNTGDVIRDVSFHLSGSVYRLRVRTVEFYTKTDETEWSMNIELDVKRGSGEKTVTIPVSGTISNSVMLVDQSDDGLELASNEYLEADETLRNFEIELDENLFITKNINKGAKLYAAVTLDLSSEDEELFAKYGAIDSVYTLKTRNVAGAGTTARFDLASTYFVYNENHEFIGTTAEKNLPFSNKYYLTTAKIEDWEEAVEEPEEPGEGGTPIDTENPAGGGGDVVTNANYNPNTGL